MNEESALSLAKELVEAYPWFFTKSARDGMRAHGIKASDVRDIVLNAEACEVQDDAASWSVAGEAFSIAEDCRVVFRFEKDAQAVIISAHRILERAT